MIRIIDQDVSAMKVDLKENTFIIGKALRATTGAIYESEPAALTELKTPNPLLQQAPLLNSGIQ